MLLGPRQLATIADFLTRAVQRSQKAIAQLSQGVDGSNGGENRCVRCSFWRYVLTACQTFDPDVGASALALLRTSQQPPFETMLTLLINDLARLTRRSVVVLEDYHVITAPSIHETLARLLDRLPTTVHLILLTRSDPRFRWPGCAPVATCTNCMPPTCAFPWWRRRSFSSRPSRSRSRWT